MKVGFLHTSPAAIPPLMQFYAREAPEIEITNLLDDGLLRLFAAKEFDLAERRLREMLSVVEQAYGAGLALVTCSAVPRELMERLRRQASIPVLKIDVPMAEMAVRAGPRIGVMVTFPPTLEPTTRLLEEAAAEAGVAVEVAACLLPEAYAELLGGNPERHDELMLEAIDRLAARPVDALVLAQVSMARLIPKLEGRLKIPFFSSLTASLAAIRRMSYPTAPSGHGSD